MGHFSGPRKFQRGAGCSPQDALQTSRGPKACIHRPLSLPLSLSSFALPPRAEWLQYLKQTPSLLLPLPPGIHCAAASEAGEGGAWNCPRQTKTRGQRLSLIKEQLRCYERLICSLCDKINRKLGGRNLCRLHFLLQFKGEYRFDWESYSSFTEIYIQLTFHACLYVITFIFPILNTCVNTILK